MRNLIAPVALFASLALSSAALAAPHSQPVVQEQDLGRTSIIGAPIEQLTLSQPVSAAGLNLVRPADVKTLERRVDAAAIQSCREVNEQYPPEFYPKVSSGSCVGSAEHQADQSVVSMVDAANGN